MLLFSRPSYFALRPMTWCLKTTTKTALGSVGAQLTQATQLTHINAEMVLRLGVWATQSKHIYPDVMLRPGVWAN